MSGIIKWLKDKQDNIVVPKTLAKCVFTEKGNNLQTLSSKALYLGTEGAVIQLPSVNPTMIISDLNYSTEEQLTGKRWIDGKPIYQKNIKGNFNVLDGSTNTILTDNNIDSLISCIGHIYYEENDVISIPSAFFIPRFKKPNLTIQCLQTGTYSRERSYNIIIQYTKTTDTASSPIEPPKINRDIIAENKDYMFLPKSGIITNILVGENDKIEVEFDYVDYNNDECIFATNKSQAGNNTIHLTLYGNKYYYGNGSSEFSFGSATTGRHTFIINDENNSCIFDGEIINNNFSISNNANYYYTFGCRGGISSNVYDGKIYRFKVTDKSTNIIKADIIPIEYVEKSLKVDGKSYEIKKSVLFDKISGTEFYNINWYSGND